MEHSLCPLCSCTMIKDFAQDAARLYYQCGDCALIFVPTKFHLSSVNEKAQYDLHRNVDEPGYRKFLHRVFDPVLNHLDLESKGLDFGCGPGPVLATMFREQGHSMSLYDQFYFPDNSVLQQEYDFITATEVFEHLQMPRDVIQTLWACLRKNGILAVMTKLAKDQLSFSTWHYKTDPTHIIFFSVQTFEFLAKSLNAEIEFFGNDVVLLRKI